MRPRGSEAGEIENRVLRVGRFAVVGERETAAEAGNGFERQRPQIPIDDIERVLTQVRHLPARIVPEPAEVIEAAVRVVWPLRSRAEEHVPIELRRRWAVSRAA